MIYCHIYFKTKQCTVLWRSPHRDLNVCIPASREDTVLRSIDKSLNKKYWRMDQLSTHNPWFRVFKGTGTRDLIWLKVVSLERS